MVTLVTMVMYTGHYGYISYSGKFLKELIFENFEYHRNFKDLNLSPIVKITGLTRQVFENTNPISFIFEN